MFLVQDFFPSDLGKLLKNETVFIPKDVIKSYVKQLLEAVAFCHSRWLLHRVRAIENHYNIQLY